MTAFELHTETFRAMAHFYSYGAVLKSLLRRDLFYTLVGLYGKRSLKKIKAPSKEYLKELRDMVSANFDEKTGKLREYVLTKKKAAINIVLNRIAEDGTETQFFRTFFKKAGKRLIISREDPRPSHGSLTIMPILHDAETGDKSHGGSLSELSSHYRAISHHLNVIPLETGSLYRACVELGLLLGIKMKKIRKAYEKATAEINGKTFECRALLVISSGDTSS
jgi:hypothetical protein